jgi:putative hydrolase of the HAD superfamily
MKIRAVIFDVYNTLLRVGPAPADADVRWAALFREHFATSPPLDRLGFSLAGNRVIARLHERARAAGVLWPEIQWPTVVAEILPAFAQLPPAAQAEFILRQIQTGHTTTLPVETADALRRLRESGCCLGIASNAQAYSLRELSEGLASHGLGMELFDPELRVWSFEHGFSKPNPHFLRILLARLEARGIAPAETLMVGDRLDNDLDPARRQGWQVFQVGAGGSPERPAEWQALVELVMGAAHSGPRGCG